MKNKEHKGGGFKDGWIHTIHQLLNHHVYVMHNRVLRYQTFMWIPLKVLHPIACSNLGKCPIIKSK